MLSHRKHTPRALKRLIFSAVLLVGLVVAPSTAAFADNITGTGGDDNLSGTPGGDTITADPTVTGADPVSGGGNDSVDGGDGDDIISGDGSALADLGGDATANGGNDTIHGGDGDDNIRGDGFARGSSDGDVTVNGGDDTIYGGAGNDTIRGDGQATAYYDGSATIVGGDDTIYGGAGNDTIYGDGHPFSTSGITTVVGGDDALYGDDGNDSLYGQEGNDFLCGGAGDDILEGGEGIDIACAVDDMVSAVAGAETMFDVTDNDEVLDDDNVQEDGFLSYAITAMSEGIIASINAMTGMLTFTAACDGTIDYAATREGNPYEATATVFVNDTGNTCLVPDDGDTEGTDDSDEVELVSAGAITEVRVLPNVGADSSLSVLAPLAAAFIMAGAAVLGAARRPRLRD